MQPHSPHPLLGLVIRIMISHEFVAQRTLRYGNDDDQVIDLCLPPDRRARGLAVLVHGGYWRQRFDRSIMEPMAELLVRDGWATANLEYRRGPDNPWPSPSSDVRLAAQTARRVAAEESLSGPLIMVGHSVGGQLCLLNSDCADAQVALAPVTDTARVFAEGLGDNAAREYFQRSPQEAPESYRRSSPICNAAPDVPTLLVQGSSDDRVPAEHTASYADSLSQPAGVDLHFFDTLGHTDLIDTASEHWESTLRWMNALTR